MQPLAASSLKHLLRNLRLLDLDLDQEWPGDPSASFSGKDSPQKNKTRVNFVEWTLFRLFQLWDPDYFIQKIEPFVSLAQASRTKSLHNALSKAFEELRTKNILGRNVFFRKSMLEDCKGERLLDVLTAFSLAILRKKVMRDKTEGNDVDKKAQQAHRQIDRDRALLVPLVISHRISLQKYLRYRNLLRVRYHDFSQVLARKDKELDLSFARILDLQASLEQSMTLEPMMSRVSELFDRTWQGERRFASCIIDGEENGDGETLLKQPFSDIWLELHGEKCNVARFDTCKSPDITGIMHGLETVADLQNSRLERWKRLKESLRHRRSVVDNVSTKLRPPTSTRSPGVGRYSFRHLQEKEKVFSPRRSPRKSTLQIMDAEKFEELVPPGHQREIPLRLDRVHAGLTTYFPYGENRHRPNDSTLQYQFDHHKNNQNAEFISSYDESKQDSTPMKNQEERSEHEGSPELNGTSASDIAMSSETLHSPTGAQSDSMRMHAMEERASVSPNASEYFTAKSLSNQGINSINVGERSAEPTDRRAWGIDPESERRIRNDTKLSLSERTRQSLFAVPTQSQSHMQPTHTWFVAERRALNPPQTPQKNPSSSMSNLLEELAQPETGYESVFKSRPRLAMSPTFQPSSHSSQDQFEPELLVISEASPLAKFSSTAML